MRKFLTNTAGALTALMIGSTAMVALPTVSAAQNVQLAQRDEQRGGGDRDRDRGGQRGDRGDRGQRTQQGDRGAQRTQRGDRGDRGDRGGQRMQRGGDRMDRSDVMRRREARPDNRRDMRREMRRGDRWDRRDRRHDRRWDRRARAPFLFLGGPRIVAREYGPGWCRGRHRGYHWAPRIGWHTGTHRGLYRCR